MARERLTDKPARGREGDRDPYPMPELFEELKAGLRFSKNDLDSALIEQPVLFHRVSEEFAKAVSRRDEARNEREAVRARLDAVIRRQYAKDSAKLTEAQLTAMIQGEEDFIEAQDNYSKLGHAADRWQALKEAFQQRSYVLKDMVQLYSANYYGDLVGSGARASAKERDYDNAREQLAERRRRS